MKVERFVLGPFGTNTYVVSDDDGKVLLIDPACSNEYERQQLYNYISNLKSQISNCLSLPRTVISIICGERDGQRKHGAFRC